MKKKRLCAAVLAAVMLLSGCEKGNSRGTENSETLVKEKVDFVFKKTEVFLPEGYSPDYTPNITYSNGEFRFEALRIGEPGSDALFASDFFGKSRAVDQMVSDMEPLMEGHVVVDCWEMPDGKILCAETGLAEENYVVTDVYLTCRNSEGKTVFCVELPAYFGYSYRRDEMYTASMGFYIYNCIQADDKIIILTNLGMCALSGSGSKVWMNTEHREHYALMDTAIGILYYSGTGGLREVNPYDGSLSEKLPFPEELISGSQYGHFIEILSGEGYDLYVKNTVGIYGVNFVTDSEGKASSESTQILNWINSGIVYTELVDVCIADPETIMIVMRDPFAARLSRTKNIPYICKKAEEDEIEEKEILHLLQVGYNYYLNTAVALFNEKSETHRVVVTDYTVYDDDDMRRQYMSLDMAAGRVPDLVFYDKSGTFDTTMRDYMESGLFADLVPLMKADETFDYDDLLGYIKNPYTNKDGEQYLFPLQPKATLYYVRPGFTDDVMTLDEFLDKLESLTEDKALTASDKYTLRDFFEYEIQRRIDYDNYTCSFDDSEFAALIERVRSGMENSHSLGRLDGFRDDYNAFMSESYSMYETSVAEIDQAARLKYYFGDDIVLTGMPNNAGKLVSYQASFSYLAVCEASPHKEEAFELLETIITVKRDIGEGGLYFGADIDRSYEAEKDIAYVVEQGSTTRYHIDNLPEGVEASFRVTAEEAAELKRVLNSIEDCVFADNKAFNIAYEEIFLGDQSRSGKQIASAVQSRVSLYLSEISK